MQKRNTHLTHRTMFALAALVIAPLSVETGYGQEDLLRQETIRRQQDVAKADELLNEGREAYGNKEFETAVQKYREALNTLPYGTATSDRREFITKSLEEGSVALTQQYRQQGKFQEARDLLEEIDKNNPGNPAAKKGLEYLDDPTRTEVGLTFEHTENVEKVRRSLYKGESFYNLGLYDKAEEEFKQVLRTDPYNKAARRWLERCSSVKSDYYRAAYDQTRAEMLMQVDRAWELAVPPLGEQVRQGPDIDSGQDRERSIIAKLNQIIIPDVKLNNITVEEAVEFLRLRSIELDNTVIDESQKGINFVVRTPKTLGEDGGAAGDDEALDGGDGFGDATDPNAILIKNLELRQVPLRVALQYICDEAKLRYKVDEFAVTLLPITEGEDADIVQRRWTVPPTFETFITTSGGGEGGGGGGDPDPFAASDDNGPAGIEPRKDIVTLLKENGVSFPPNSSASFLKSSSTLIVRNTPTNLELIDGIVQAAINDTPRQIRVTTKFVEVSQENGEELGFDWIATPFGVGSNYFLGGGTVGSGTARNNTDFIGTVDRVNIPGIPASPQENVSNIVTSSLRSGSAAVNRNSIDAILNNPTRTAQANSVAPGILSMTGLFSSGQVQMIMRGLAQKKGADIMTAPSVVALPGQNATIEIIREFIYPTEYEPPELPNQVGGGIGNQQGGVGGGGGGAGFPVTPATPSAFDTKNTGVTLEVEAQIDANDSIIELRFTPTIVEFEGFINYGSPITAPATDALGNPVQIVITENRIEMPVFSVRSVKTGLTIYDGYTVAVGGLMREDVQSVEDKVPVLGDLPYVGRLFQTKAQNHIKSNLIIFVTAEIIDATGKRVNGGDTATAPSVGGGAADTALPSLPGD
ncbi:MAG: Amuc_1098 family type IV pilus outer membrane protein [Akkermansiaceae bacterium]